MKKSPMAILMILIRFTLVFAQENYEPGVILLKVKEPEVVSIVNNQAINGSPELQAVFRKYEAVRARKISHVDARTDGLYRLDFPLEAPLDTIRSALVACSDIMRARDGALMLFCP